MARIGDVSHLSVGRGVPPGAAAGNGRQNREPAGQDPLLT